MISIATSAPRTVLIADDDADMRLYVRSCLRGLGCTQVLEAEDGVEALHLLRSVAVDLVISDVMMPRLDGAALCHTLKADPALKAIPVVLISGEVDRRLPEADACLAKPFNAEMLHTCISPFLDRPP